MQSAEDLSNQSESIALVMRWHEGDEEAARLLFDRYVQRLLDLVGPNLPAGFARRFGPDDVIQSVFRSLFRAVKEDRLRLERSGDLWAWLLQITFNKLSGRMAYHLAAKRSVAREEALSPGDDAENHSPLAFWSREPSAEDLVAIIDELDYLFGPSEGSPLRRALDLRLQDLSMEEIAARMDVSHTTISRYLRKIGRRFEDRLRMLSEDRHFVGGSI
jgi:RNA polymerase sigma factor (sigma-70 family)